MQCSLPFKKGTIGDSARRRKGTINDEYSSDVAVLGGGPGGYTAAIRAAQEGKSVAIVEMDRLGGTCLHRGCIPSKALLRSAEIYQSLLEADTYGIKVDKDAIKLDFSAVQERKEHTVEQLHRGLQQLMKKHGIQIIHGKGRIVGPSIFSPKSGMLAVELEDGEMESVSSTNLIIATGSRPRICLACRRMGSRS